MKAVHAATVSTIVVTIVVSLALFGRSHAATRGCTQFTACLACSDNGCNLDDGEYAILNTLDTHEYCTGADNHHTLPFHCFPNIDITKWWIYDDNGTPSNSNDDYYVGDCQTASCDAEHYTNQPPCFLGGGGDLTGGDLSKSMQSSPLELR